MGKTFRVILDFSFFFLTQDHFAKRINEIRQNQKYLILDPFEKKTYKSDKISLVFLLLLLLNNSIVIFANCCF